jgi:protein tyrosine phosphatase (PTP) superfamily phosphohydrolase (DUF442 family)
MQRIEQPLAGIQNYRRIGDRLGTSGQPTEKEFPAIREAGFEAVINLALPSSDNALPHEGSIVTSLGMTYIHIPVNFQNPTVQDFQNFCGVISGLKGRRLFIHCAANKRVSAFVFLYRVLHQKVDLAEAKADLDAIWQPDAAWSRFIQERLSAERR